MTRTSFNRPGKCVTGCTFIGGTLYFSKSCFPLTVKICRRPVSDFWYWILPVTLLELFLASRD